MTPQTLCVREAEDPRPHSAPRVNTSDSVCAGGWGPLVPLGPGDSHTSCALGTGLPQTPGAGHIRGAVRPGREGSLAGDRIASVPQERPGKPR